MNGSRSVGVDSIKIVQNLEVLQQISAGDFVAPNLFFHQSVWSQEERHQLSQLPLKVSVDV